MKSDDVRSVGDPFAAQRVEDLPDAPVEFLDHISVDARAACPFERRRRKQRHMRKRVSEVQEELFVFLLTDGLHRLFGVTLRERRLIGRSFDDFAIANQRHIPAVCGRSGQTRRSLRQTGASIHVV